MALGREQPERTVVLQDQALRRLKGFTQVPNAVLRHPTLSHGAKLTFGVLLSYAWQEDFCRPAQETLASDMGCSIRQVRRFLVELRFYYFVNWRQQGLNRPNVYYILPQTRWVFGAAASSDGTDVTVPDRTDLSHPDRTPATDLDGTPVSDKEDSMKKTHINVNVGNEGKTPGAEHRTPTSRSRRRWDLTAEQLDEADAMAQVLIDELGQPTNRNSYFVCAADALSAGRREAFFEALSVTKAKRNARGVDETPSQYFHGVLKTMLRKRKPSPQLETARAHSRAARDAFVSRSAFPTNP